MPPRPDTAWRTYLVDHLTGSDTAFVVVTRLARTAKGTPAGDLCAWLHPQLASERDLLAAMIVGAGGRVSRLSPKRLASYATGAVAQVLAGGTPGDLALFRTVESLAIAVQGKRLLWRAAAARARTTARHEVRRFRDLEQDALTQWKRIEALREALVRATFTSQR